MIVAIDGPAGSGKSTTARAVANRLGFRYLDTGAMYRAVTLGFQEAGAILEPERREEVLAGMRIDVSSDGRRARVELNGRDVSEAIRQPSVGREVSIVAALPSVRAKLVEEQRRIGRELVARGGGLVVDGRDIGTHVFPNAQIKFYIKADARVRARRRALELQEAGVSVTVEDVLAEIQERDLIDSTRSVAPLKKAADAIEVDTTDLTIEEQVDRLVRLVRERRGDTTV